VKFCQPHWEAMRAAVDARGMSHLVARDGHEAIENEVLRLRGDTSPQTWDPLMAAHWAIAERVINRIGHSQGPAAALSALGGEDFCPLCEVQKSFDSWDPAKRPPEAHDAQGWVDDCMDAMRKHAVAKGLVPSNA
jgi:hypothetical protein